MEIAVVNCERPFFFFFFFWVGGWVGGLFGLLSKSRHNKCLISQKLLCSTGEDSEKSLKLLPPPFQLVGSPLAQRVAVLLWTYSSCELV